MIGHGVGTGHTSRKRWLSANSTAKALIERYAKRMDIEQRLAEAIRSFGLDALASAVPLNVDLDVVLCVLAHTICAVLRRRLPGYATATPDTLQRRFLNTSGLILNHGNQTTVRLDRRAYSLVLRQADIRAIACSMAGCLSWGCTGRLALAEAVGAGEIA